jgi:hypothetical protein
MNVLSQTQPMASSRWLILCVLAYALYEAKDLWFAWNHSPFDAFGWMAFAIWIAPVFVPREKQVYEPVFVMAGIGLILLGQMGELNLLKYLGLAAILAGLQAFKKGREVWLFCSLSWMPLFGYFLSLRLPDLVPPLRLLVASLGVLLLLRANREAVVEEIEP